MHLLNREYTSFEKFLYKLCYDDSFMKKMLLIDIFLIALICSFLITEYQLYIHLLKFYYE